MATPQCGYRHGGEWGRKRSNFRFVKGEKLNGYYPHAHAVCVGCGRKVPGVASELFPAELAKATTVTRSNATRSVIKRSEPQSVRARGMKNTRIARKSTFLDWLDPTRKGRHSK